MSAVLGIAREIWGLFVDDGSLAATLVLWCAAAAFGLPHLPLPAGWDGPVFFVGCLTILLANILRAGRRRAGG